MSKLFGKSPTAVFLILAVLGALAITGCSPSSGTSGTGTGTGTQTGADDQPAGTTMGGSSTVGEGASSYQREQVDFYMGITEPRSDALAEMAREADRLLGDHVNTVGLLPPVLINSRAGGWPRVILEGSATSVEGSIDDFHDAALAVFLAPTTASPGFQERIEPSDTALEHLSEDVLKWAGKAEEHQVELFAPLSRCNWVLGTEAANRWSASVLSGIRDAYSGELAAKVVPDIGDPPPPGQPHDFEQLDYRGYDYLMLDIFPSGDQFNEDEYRAYVADLLDRAVAVAGRDGLKGVIVGEFGGWRSQAGMDKANGPMLGNDGQSVAAAVVLDELRRKDVFGAFFQGWTTPGRGARDFPVEKTLAEYFGSSVVVVPAGATD